MAEVGEFVGIVAPSENVNVNLGAGCSASTSEICVNTQMLAGSVDSELSKRVPKRILQFSDGILEEYSSSDEESEELKDLNQVDAGAVVDPRQLTWAPFIWYQFKRFGNRTLSACDFLGEHVADFFGITSPKYQYEIDEYFRLKADEDNERKKNMEMSSWSEGATAGTTSESVAIDAQPNAPDAKERY